MGSWWNWINKIFCKLTFTSAEDVCLTIMTITWHDDTARLSAVRTCVRGRTKGTPPIGQQETLYKLRDNLTAAIRKVILFYPTEWLVCRTITNDYRPQETLMTGAFVSTNRDEIYIIRVSLKALSEVANMHVTVTFIVRWIWYIYPGWTITGLAEVISLGNKYGLGKHFMSLFNIYSPACVIHCG